MPYVRIIYPSIGGGGGVSSTIQRTKYLVQNNTIRSIKYTAYCYAEVRNYQYNHSSCVPCVVTTNGNNVSVPECLIRALPIVPGDRPHSNGHAIHTIVTEDRLPLAFVATGHAYLPRTYLAHIYRTRTTRSTFPTRVELSTTSTQQYNIYIYIFFIRHILYRCILRIGRTIKIFASEALGTATWGAESQLYRIP